MKTIADKVKENKPIEVPYHVWRFLGENSKTVLISSEQVSIGEDSGTVEEIQKALEWYITQFNGKVTWSKK